MQIGELAERLDLPLRSIRYALERRHAKKWVEDTPGSGYHRDLSGGQAFALGLLTKIKAVGFRAPQAEHVVAFVEEGLRAVARSLGWDPGFAPFRGELETSHRWYVEVGDGRAFRLATNADPSGGGKMTEFPWVRLGKRRVELPEFEPCVSIKIDLTRLASLVRE